MYLPAVQITVQIPTDKNCWAKLFGFLFTNPVSGFMQQNFLSSFEHTEW